MIQEIIVGILFIVAVAYVINVVRKQLKAKSACGSAVCKCDSKPKLNKATPTHKS